ncbi:MAG TPA: hypothetical protein ENK91_14940 [Bacteroidetes bacterium]|nr:hypothetical protein [Bacteroidota bacterium]
MGKWIIENEKLIKKIMEVWVDGYSGFGIKWRNRRQGGRGAEKNKQWVIENGVAGILKLEQSGRLRSRSEGFEVSNWNAGIMDI